MVYHLQRLRFFALRRRSGTAFHPADVSAYSFPADIPSGGAIQFLRNYVRLHDHAVLR